MMRLIDPKGTHVFIPESEKGADKPTTFHVRPMTLRQSVKIAEAARQSRDGGQTIPIDAIYELVSGTVVKIENGLPGLDETDVAAFLDACSTPEAIGVVFDLFRFIQNLSTLDEAERGN
jgi:hypothetical protein